MKSKKGISIFDFIISVIIIVGIGELLISTANVLSTNSESNLVNGVKEKVFSYMSSAKEYCTLNNDASKKESVLLYQNQSIDITTECVSSTGKIVEVTVTGCFNTDNYCYNNKGYIYVQ